MSPPPGDPFGTTVNWLAAHARFPASRLGSQAEILLCLAALAAAGNEAESQRYLVQSRDKARDSALRAHLMRRSLAHHQSDNGQKV
jgi:hypothetical protein